MSKYLSTCKSVWLQDPISWVVQASATFSMLMLSTPIIWKGFCDPILRLLLTLFEFLVTFSLKPGLSRHGFSKSRDSNSIIPLSVLPRRVANKVNRPHLSPSSASDFRETDLNVSSKLLMGKVWAGTSFLPSSGRFPTVKTRSLAFSLLNLKSLNS